MPAAWGEGVKGQDMQGKEGTMTERTQDADGGLESRVLLMLRLKGFAGAEAIAACLGVGAAPVAALLADLVAAGLAEEKKIGHRLTPDGQAVADADTAAERGQVDDEVIAAFYARFNDVNPEFKALVARWQMREVDGAVVPNDHSDTAYDRGIIAALATIDGVIRTLMTDMSATLPRMARYNHRFAAALEALKQGEVRYMAAPVIDSYHTVWFELHEDLIRLSGKTRRQEALAGKAV